MPARPAPAVATPPVADTAALASRLRIAVARTARTLRREAGEGVSPTLICALATLERHGRMTLGALADHERVSKPTITRTVRELLEQGLVVRSPDADDGRIAWLTLSGAGRRLLGTVRRRKDEYLARRLRQMGPAELAVLDRAAAILAELEEVEP